MKPRKPDPTQQSMEDVANLVEEHHHVMVTHQRRGTVWRGFGKVGYDSCDGVHASRACGS